MKRFIKGLAIIGITLVAFTDTTVQASAKRHYVKTPTSLRGNWYSLNHVHNTLSITKYTFSGMEGIHNHWKLSGKKFSKHMSTPELYVGKGDSPRGYYWIGLSSTDAGQLYRRTTLKFHGKKYSAIKQLNLISYNPVKYQTTYWTHQKNLKR